MYTVRVLYRGRDLVVHRTESREDALELVRVYRLLGYEDHRVIVEEPESDTLQAA